MTLQLKITLLGTQKPPVWRRVAIDDAHTFFDLHGTIQTVFGWHSSHLWEFGYKPFDSELSIGMVMDDVFSSDERKVTDAQKVQLEEYLYEEGQVFSYMYDFGDSWEHQIVVEKTLDDILDAPSLLAGKGKCPPEDCGGVWGYYNLVEAVNDPKHEEHEDMREWLGMNPGEKWDVNEFDLAVQQEKLEDAFG
ncbi:MAG: plasmid pRiA4b ORF-3 family protein [Bacteroidota bacterium]